MMQQTHIGRPHNLVAKQNKDEDKILNLHLMTSSLFGFYNVVSREFDLASHGTIVRVGL